MKKIGLIFILFLLPIIHWAQPDLPSEFVLDKPGDYSQYENLVIESIEWLLKTPLEEEVNLRAKHNAFDLIWLSGSPTILLEIETKAMPFMESHEELFYTFMFGMALKQLQHPDKKYDSVKLHSYGLEAVAIMVIQSHDVEMNPVLRKIVKAHRKGKLKEYTQELMSAE